MKSAPLSRFARWLIAAFTLAACHPMGDDSKQALGHADGQLKSPETVLPNMGDNVAQYSVRSADGRYHHRRITPAPSTIHDDVWTYKGQAFPFDSIDAMFEIDNADGPLQVRPGAPQSVYADRDWQVFISGSEYIIWSKAKGYFSCPLDRQCSVTSKFPSSLSDGYWIGFPFPDGVDAAMQFRYDTASLRIFSRGNEYVLYQDGAWFHGNAEPGPGTIGDSFWTEQFPFSTVDAMAQWTDPSGNDVLIFVNDSQYVLYDLSLEQYGPQGSLSDAYWSYSWQKAPFGAGDDDTRFDSLLVDGESLIIVSNAPLVLEPPAGGLKLFDDREGGIPQRVILLQGSDYEKGFTYGYLLGEEIMALLNEYFVPAYDRFYESPDGVPGYNRVRGIGHDLYYFDPETVSMFAGMLAGIEANPLTNGLMTDSLGTRQVDEDDLRALHLVDDLSGITCKSATMWPDPFQALPEPVHAFVMDAPVLWDDNNIIVVDDNSDNDKKSWVATSFVGFTKPVMFAMNEDGMTASAVSSSYGLRNCPQGTEDCLGLRLSVRGPELLDSSSGYMDSVLEHAVSISHGYNNYAATKVGISNLGVTVTMPYDPNRARHAATYEYLAIGMPEVHNVDPAIVDDVFPDSDAFPLAELREPAFDELVGSRPILVHAPELIKAFNLFELPGYNPYYYDTFYVGLRDLLLLEYPVTNPSLKTFLPRMTEIMKTSALEPITWHDPFDQVSATQYIIAVPKYEGGQNNSIVTIRFANERADQAFKSGANSHTYTWGDFFWL